MATDKPLLLSAMLENIKIDGVVEHGRRSKYSVRFYVDNEKVMKSESKPRSGALEWEWNVGNKIFFEPSSSVKIELKRGFGIKGLPDAFVAQYEGNVVDLLESSESFELKDEKGAVIPAKMKIALSQTAGSEDNIKEFLEKIDGDVARLGVVENATSTLGQVLQLTKKVMDQFTQVHPISKASWTVVSCVYEAVQATNIQDDLIQDLAGNLRELLGTANMIPNLPVVQNTENIIEGISRQSLQVAALIHEYTKLPFTHRTAKIQVSGDLKKRIETCQKRCLDLKASFYNRIHLDTNTRVNDTNTQVKEIKTYQEQTGRKLETVVDKQLEDKINGWLSPPDSSSSLYEADEKRQEDSCTWFLEGERYHQWKENPGFLWVKGNAGSGKSILSSAIINELPVNHPSFNVAYFFFDGRDSQSALQLHHNLFRSLISQFSHQMGGTPAALANLYSRCGDSKQPSVKDLENTLRDILVGIRHAYIIIDAVDECTDRNRTVAWVGSLVSGITAVERVHILAASRPETDITNAFEMLDPHCVDIGTETANEDILFYTRQQMNMKFKMYNKMTRQTIESALVHRAGGSFRWVALQIAELENCSSEYEIMQQLKNLPDGLDRIYGRILSNIQQKYIADTRTFLQWLAFCRRPMTVEEIAETITVDFDLKDGPAFNPARRYANPRDMLKRCSSLVYESERRVKLSHFSVKEYLLHHVEEYLRLDEKTSHSEISEIAVIYLLQFDAWASLTEDALRSSPLALYAAEYWIYHAQCGEMNQYLVKSILHLFTPNTAAFANWIYIYNVDDSIWGNQWQPYSLEQDDLPNPLYYASWAGFEQVAQYLVMNGADINVRTGRCGTAIGAASFLGHQAIVELLLKNGADVNVQAGHYRTALGAASVAGHIAIVKLLQENGADVNAHTGYYGTALGIASNVGHKAIVELLLENGADVNKQTEHSDTALSLASVSGHKHIVKLLLKNGADVNAQAATVLYWTALGTASNEGHQAIVELLLENGANVNAQGGIYGTALGTASNAGHHAIVELLLNNGADVNAQGGMHGTALGAAVFKGHKSIIELLLENGADANAQGGEYGTVLGTASYYGPKAIVKLLLENGADVNAQGGKYGTALGAASYEGDVDIVKLLLENGADVNAQGGEYGTALGAALYWGYRDIVELLLENGANVNAQGGEYGTALGTASHRGQTAIVKLLLEKGADVNAQGGKYGTALGAASYKGDIAIVELLLEKGADVNAEGGDYGTALGAASLLGQETIIRLLLERGANVNVQSDVYGTALAAASYGGREDIVELLLDNGADVNAQGGLYGTALGAAACWGSQGVIKLLLANKAQVNARGGKFGTPLCVASYRGQEAAIELLLANGADVNASEERYGTALCTASYSGDQKIVVLLLQNGAEVNVHRGYDGNALQTAEYNWNLGIMTLLMEHGAIWDLPEL